LSSGFLLDTNVASASAPGKPALDRAVAKWFRESLSSRPLFISVITLAEIELGIALLEKNGPTRRTTDLRQWLADFEHEYAGKLLDVSARIAREIGQMDASARLRGHAPELADLVIAATAHIHNLTILTRNSRHFEPLGVSHFDPFSALPS
jgi:predicted nucleic acid-binding protein